jgi:hypothetical protein
VENATSKSPISKGPGEDKGRGVQCKPTGAERQDITCATLTGFLSNKRVFAHRFYHPAEAIGTALQLHHLRFKLGDLTI